MDKCESRGLVGLDWLELAKLRAESGAELDNIVNVGLFTIQRGCMFLKAARGFSNIVCGVSIQISSPDEDSLVVAEPEVVVSCFNEDCPMAGLRAYEATQMAKQIRSRVI